jgi:hypothetical protein
MSIKIENQTTTITCDKCGRSSTAPNDLYNEWFYEEGWALHRGRKYEHLCNRCLSPKARKAMAFVKEIFGL